MGTVVAMQKTKLCMFFRYNEPTGQWLEINYLGSLTCSCGSETLMVASGRQIGCKAVVDHGSRNIPDVVHFIEGHISNLELALAELAAISRRR